MQLDQLTRLCTRCNGKKKIVVYNLDDRLVLEAKNGATPHSEVGCHTCNETGAELTEKGRELIDIIRSYLNDNTECRCCGGKGDVMISKKNGHYDYVDCPVCEP
jgi:predicted methyltransferase